MQLLEMCWGKMLGLGNMSTLYPNHDIRRGLLLDFVHHYVMIWCKCCPFHGIQNSSHFFFALSKALINTFKKEVRGQASSQWRELVPDRCSVQGHELGPPAWKLTGIQSSIISWGHFHRCLCLFSYWTQWVVRWSPQMCDRGRRSGPSGRGETLPS